MTQSLIELRKREERISNAIFTLEKSRLFDLNSDFARFENNDFLAYLRDLSGNKEKLSVLEIGGGVQQVAARELLNLFPNLYLTGIEMRQLDQEAKSDLQRTGRFTLLSKGFSQAQDDLKERRFDVIYLHNVLQHLPSPFFMIEQCYRFLDDDGILFVNGILIYEDEWRKILEFLNRKGCKFFHKEGSVNSSLLKKGIISVSLSLRKNAEHDDLNLPLEEGDFLSDYEGNRLAVREIRFK
jgi:SAM-dependent methyltransferase